MKLARPLVMLIALLLLLGMSGLAHAFDYDAAASLEKIEADQSARNISLDEAALYTAEALMDPAQLPARYHVAGRNLAKESGVAPAAPFCGTPAMLRLHELLDQVSPATRERIEKMLLPGKPRGEADAAKSGLADNPNGVALPNVYYTDRFAIRWGDDYNADMGMIEFWGDILENEVWATEVVSWDYPNVYLTDQYYIDMYVGNSGDGAPTIGFSGAYTTIYEGSYQPYIVFYPDLLYSEEVTQEVSAHEFFHTIQFTLGMTGVNYYIFDYDGTWFVEGSATWAESIVYPTDSYIYYIYDWADNPSQALTGDSGYAPYARVIWTRYLYEKIDGLETLHNIWTSSRGTSCLFGNAGYLASIDKAWDETFFDFAARVLVQDFQDGDRFPSFDSFRTVSTFPYSQDSVDASSRPHINSLHNLLVRPGDAASPKLNIRFKGEDITLSGVEWILAAIKIPAGGGEPVVELLKPGKGAKSDFTVTGLGTDYDKIYLVVTPLSNTEDNNNANWDYLLQMTRGDDPFPAGDDDDTADDDTVGNPDDDNADDDAFGDDDSGDDDDDDDSGCGC
ncbi:MAG: hypothetical protein GX444_18665 [Myxococcales bacterium]|nr:hypothetical protein [Myxococcales bacterium]